MELPGSLIPRTWELQLSLEFANAIAGVSIGRFATSFPIAAFSPSHRHRSHHNACSVSVLASGTVDDCWRRCDDIFDVEQCARSGERCHSCLNCPMQYRVQNSLKQANQD